MTNQANTRATHTRTPKRQRPSLQLSKLRKLRPRDLATRFVLGALTSILSAAIAATESARAGGPFLAFPAILLAGLTLVEKKEGPEKTRQDAHGAIIGAIALAAFATLTTTLLTRTNSA